MKKLQMTLVQMLLTMVGLLATVALAMGIPDVPSGTSHHELYQVMAISAAPCNLQDCGQADRSDGSKQTHHHKCRKTVACSVFGIITSPLQVTGPEIVRTFLVRYWPPLSSSDPQDLLRPPKRLLA
ncbi:hypothetical protein ACE033_22405 [Rhizobium sp. IMFF44]